MENIKELYENRFNDKEIKDKNLIWKVLCERFFCKYIGKNDIVLDVAGGYCEFINNINCGKKIVVDLNPDVKNFANPDVKILNQSAVNLSDIQNGSVDVVFMSNFLEHINNKNDIIQILRECYRILKLDGRLLIMQPNIKYLYKEYWDFFDHHTPLTEKSLMEAIQISNPDFKIEVLIPRFMPYTTKGRLPKNKIFIELYLKMPFVWKLLGKQIFTVARKQK